MKRYLEPISAILSIATSYIGAKQYIAIWPISISITLINIFIYYDDMIYASVLQNLISILVSLYGWYSWQYGGKNKTELIQITRTTAKQALLLLLSLSAYALLLYPLLQYLGSTLKLLDITRTALTMAGMWATSNKKLETYPIWLVVNLISIIVFYQKANYWFVAKYIFLALLSIYSFNLWRQQYNTQKTQ